MYSNYNDLIMPPTKEVGGSFLGLVGAAAAFTIVVLCIIFLIIAIITIIAQCKVFDKAGEKWWKALIPLYNNWVFTKITGLAWWWFVIALSLSTLVVMYSENDAVTIMGMALFLANFNYYYNLSKKFGKSNGFAVLLSILPFIGLPILAFGSSNYNKTTKVDENGIFKIEK